MVHATGQRNACLHGNMVARTGTQNENPQTTDNKATTSKKRVKIVNVQAPLTEEKIRLYKQVFPNRDIQFNVYEPPQPIPKAA